MADFEQPHIFNPHVEYWVLHNKFTNDQHVVQWPQIIEAFGDNQAQKMLNGYHDYWEIYRYVK